MDVAKEKALNEAFEQLMAISLNQVSLEGVEEIVDPKVMGYGTTVDEQVHDLKGYISLIKAQEEQAAGLDFIFERKEVYRRYSPSEDTAVFVEEIKAIINSDEIENQLSLRFSAVMEYKNESWKLIHWHGSVPSDTEDDTWHVDEWKKEKEKLEQKVAEQTAGLQQKNRELEIEAALERVRSRTMAMHNSDELQEVGSVLFQQLEMIGLSPVSSWISLVHPELKCMDTWVTHGNNLREPKRVSVADHPNFEKEIRAWVDEQPFINIQLPKKDFITTVKEIWSMDVEDRPDRSDFHVLNVRHKYGFLGIGSWDKVAEDNITTYQRFAKVFEQTYTRFLDLQKAENQARDNQIELSLERIRAQATGMQVSSDLLDIVVTMHAEFTGLGHEAHYFWHMRWLENTYEKAMTSGDGSRIGNVMELPRNFHQNEAMNEWEQNEESLGIFTFAAEAAIDYVDRMISEGRFDKIDHNAPGPDDIRAIGGLTFVMARTTHGEIGYSLPGVVENPPAEDMETLERFAGVFDLAYRRFEDLLDAEKRAYESKVETSLERVRGMAAAMNHSDDLMQIAEAMFKEMEILKINPLRYGIAMIDGEKKEAELWASTVNDGHYLDMLGIIPLEWHPMLNSAYEAWSAQHEELIYKLEGKELSDYYQKIGPINPEIPDLESLQNPETSKVQYCSFFPFNHGILYAFTDGEPGEEGCSILKRFSSAFEQAHIRYHDLQKAELQARQIREERDRLEVALKELESTKDQLVQQEKLASLGQLTAGIAHEIKNPLNFVNNFSDLSLELVEEIREELRQRTGGDQSHLRQGSGGQGKTKNEKGENPLLRGDGIAEGDGRGVSDGADDSEHSQSNDAALGSANTPLNPSASWRREAGLSPDPDLILDILNDIEANLKTIHKHGSRADSIVKSMLQHSRGGDGKMEPTPLNPLIKEYVNLAFHGMRAGKDPINVDIDLQLDENVGEVPVIAEDFSRVILNLTNNAFDAMREKVTEDGRPETVEDTLRQPTESGKAERSRGVSSIDEYTPKLSVRTKSDGNTITIEIEDNGHGIPDDMKDKILQPFFTTKKGTAGTGLGLSITNDIIKAHGGYLSIPESDEAGTTFRIELKATE